MAIDLNQISVAKPCSANWDEMSGDERSRHCGMCKLNVYNLSGMTSDQIEALIQAKEGKLCVRLFKRTDGTVITQDCPVGLAKLRKRLAILSGAMAASIFLAAGTVLAKVGFGNDSGRVPPSQAVKNWLNPPVPHTEIMGKMAMPSPLTLPPVAPPPATPAPSPAADAAGQ